MGGSPIFTFTSYLKYRKKAVGAHSLHSPFVFKLFNEVVRKCSHYRIKELEAYRRSLRSNHLVVDVIDFKNNISQRKTIRSIAKTSLSSARFSAFLHLLINELQCKTVLETGTSLGLNTLYLDHSDAEKVVTLEASPILAELAKKEFELRSKNSIELVFGNVHETYVSALERHQPDFIFLDADHRGFVVKNQVDQIITHSTQTECIVIHDIYWSRDMNQTWIELVNDDRFSLTIDIFQAGILFLNKGIEKQHFTLRF